jgi:hypothetical protein
MHTVDDLDWDALSYRRLLNSRSIHDVLYASPKSRETNYRNELNMQGRTGFSTTKKIMFGTKGLLRLHKYEKGSTLKKAGVGK